MVLSLAILSLSVGLAAGVSPAPADGSPRYYMILFGGQSERFRPRTAHTWATYVKAVPGAPLEEFTISWLPASMDVRPSRLRAEPGINVPLHRTLELMTDGNHRVSMWGPFEVRQDFYEKSCQWKAFLDREGKYRVLTMFDLSRDIHHCVDAVVHADPALRRKCEPVVWYGEAITQRVANALAATGIVSQPHVAHDWLIPALDLGKYQLTREPVGRLPLVHLLPTR
jgi:hypothetical protein